MPDKKYSEFTEDTTPETTDTTTSRRGSNNFRATWAQYLGAFFGANQILKADSALTVVGLTVAEDRILGRIAGDVIDDLTPTQVRTIINVANGATANPNAVEATSTFGTDNRLIRSDSTSRLAQASGITVDDSANMSGVVGITATGDVSTTGDVVGKWQGLVTASTSITITDSHNGQIIYCTAGTTVTATHGDAVSTDVHYTIVQCGNGQVQVVPSGSVTLLKRTGFNAYTNGAGAGLVVHVKQAASALGTWVSGDMEPV